MDEMMDGDQPHAEMSESDMEEDGSSSGSSESLEEGGGGQGAAGPGGHGNHSASDDVSTDGGEDDDDDDVDDGPEGEPGAAAFGLGLGLAFVLKAGDRGGGKGRRL